ncbi:Protein of unknown function [Pyronema omphalodes CBS 100304]|uniref:Uncharacterized protein n=1 Tax=Pyronema omphalodes (strain CBS 100304) TaxID=1076935 RepID=U4LM31_PYROM|nr:Protein of unknown function [Pyronema omphalodes CBS 100304]
MSSAPTLQLAQAHLFEARSLTPEWNVNMCVPYIKDPRHRH